MSVSISPVFNGIQFFDNAGLPLNGGLIYQYEAGSNSVEQDSYTNDTGSPANSNPIVLDSSGRMNGVDIWLTDGLAYNLVVKDSDDNFLTGVDDVIGVVASSTVAQSTLIWVQIVPAPTFVNGTTFLLPGNLTTEFTVGNRVQIEYTTNVFRYGTVTAVLFSSPNTQITLVNDSAVQDAGMTKAYWSLNVVNGKTVDAGAVTSNVPGSYTTPLTVGYALNALTTSDTAINTRIDSTYKVWPTSGGTTAYTITPSPAIASYAVGEIFAVKFNSSCGAAPTINVNGLGAVPFRARNSSFALTSPTTYADMVTQLGYDGTVFVILDPPPPVVTPAATSAGMWGYYNAAAQAVTGNVNFQTASGNEVGVSGYVAGVLSVQNTGVYHVSAAVTYYTGGGYNGLLELAIFKNGITTGFKNQARDGNNDGSQYGTSVTGLIQLTAGDNVSIRATLSGGSSIPGTGFGTFTGIRLS